MTGLVLAIATTLIVLGVVAMPIVLVGRARAVAAVAAGGCLVLVAGASSVTTTATGRSTLNALGPLVIALSALVTTGPGRLAKVAMIGGLLAGPLRLLVDDPFLDPACPAECVSNPFALLNSPTAATAMLFLGYSTLLTALLAQIIRGHVPRIAIAVVGAAGLLLLLGADLGWCAGAGAAAAAALGGDLIRSASRRGRLSAAVDTLMSHDEPETLLRRELRAPELRIGYATGEGEWVDKNGEPLMSNRTLESCVEVNGPEGPIAQIRAPRGVVETNAWPRLLRGPLRLALDNARLRALAAVQAREISASSRRLIEHADAERRRLERDLHDGAQQHVLALGLVLSLHEVDPATDAKPGANAGTEALIARVLDDLRELSHGLHSAALESGGLGHALSVLAHRSPVAITVHELPPGRLDRLREITAYSAVEEVVTSADGPVEVAVRAVGGDLHVAIDVVAPDMAPGTCVPPSRSCDRFRALSGSIDTVTTSSGYRVVGILPISRGTADDVVARA